MLNPNSSADGLFAEPTPEERRPGGRARNGCFAGGCVLRHCDPCPTSSSSSDRSRLLFLLQGTSFNASTSANWSAVIGSLPKGLTNDEKMRIKMNVPPSPSAALLKELNPVSS